MREETDFSTLLGRIDRSRSVVYTSSKLNLYQRLIQYFSIVLEARGRYLDLINFTGEYYPQVVSLAESETLFTPEHGYGSPDGSTELSFLIREYELARIRRFKSRVLGNTLGESLCTYQLAGGIGAGTTGVMNCLIPAIRDFWIERGATRRTGIVVTLPLYSVYDGIVSGHGLEPVYLQTCRANDFLPKPHEVEEVLRDKPLAIIVTFPGNPAQTTFAGRNVSDLQEIVRLCQEQETFLIVDNIYQDTIWNGEEINPEVLGFSATPDWLLKVWGPSKDRPACSGWRVGYYVGDPRLQELFFYYSSIQYNTPNSASRCMLALDILLRLLQLEGRDLAREDLDLLGDALASWRRPLDRDALFESLSNEQLFPCFARRLEQVETLQRNANQLLRETCLSLDVFSDVVNNGIGNLLLVRVREDLFSGNCHELFLYLMEKVGIGILPGNAFGFPLERKNAWFRITTIHDHPSRIATDLERVALALRSNYL